MFVSAGFVCKFGGILNTMVRNTLLSDILPGFSDWGCKLKIGRVDVGFYKVSTNLCRKKVKVAGTLEN